MTALTVVPSRLRNQRLVPPLPKRPEDVVRWLCAVQAQDYQGSLWGIAQRTPSATEAEVEHAIEERTIVRTWPMRGTLHFVAAEDVRWITRLLAPRVIQRAARRYEERGLDPATFSKSRARIEEALSGGKALTRPAIYEVLARAGVATEEDRGNHILGWLAMNGALCFGARSGRQPTFVLLDEWIPTSRVLDRDEALGELAQRYFASHGPATVHDFAWWSGLPLGDSRRGIDVAGESLRAWRSEGAQAQFIEFASRTSAKLAPAWHLLPAYDEYTVAYRDRSAFLDAEHAEPTRNGIFSSVVLIQGRIGGTWKRTAKADRVDVAIDLFERPSAKTRHALEGEAARYGRFLGKTASVSFGQLLAER